MDADEIARIEWEDRAAKALLRARQLRWDNVHQGECITDARAVLAVLAPLVEQARQEGAREALRAAARSEFFDGSRRCLDEMADRAERAATPGSRTAGGGT